MADFSLIPEAIVCLIISLLPFKEAAKTSILSQKWLHLWHSSTNLQFHETFFVKPEQDSAESIENGRRVFLEFIHRFLQTYREPAIHRFELSFSNPQFDHVTQFEHYIRFATDRKVRVLDLDFSDPSWDATDADEEPPSLIEFKPSLCAHASEFLESLRLFSCGFDVLEFTANFAAMKSISLGWISFTCCSLHNLLLQCPSLENLSLIKCWDLVYANVSSSTLKTLVIENCSIDYFAGVSIDAKNLVFFKYSGESCSFDIEHSTNLEEAWVDFEAEEGYCEEGEALQILIIGLSGVRVLTVCSYMLQVITTSGDLWLQEPQLPMLQHLIFRTRMDEKEFYGMSFFLNSCPFLQVLSFHIRHGIIFEEHETPFEVKEHPFLMGRLCIIVPTCLKRTLRVVEVKGFTGNLNEMCVLTYLLKFSRVLETLSITISKKRSPLGVNMERYYRLQAQTLLRSQKASPNVNISIA